MWGPGVSGVSVAGQIHSARSEQAEVLLRPDIAPKARGVRWGRGSDDRCPALRRANPYGRKARYLKAQAVADFRGRTINRWAQRSLAGTAKVLTDGMRSFKALREVGRIRLRTPSMPAL